MMGLGIIGAEGRMGRAIVAAATSRGVPIAGGIGRTGAVAGSRLDLPSLAAAASILIDFSRPDALDATLTAAEAAATPVLVGTTGLDAGHQARIDRAAARIAVLQSANTSLGVALLAALVEQAARRLGPEWDIEIVEMHHRHKRDAPSGTALMLGAAAGRGRGATSPGMLDRFDRTEAREEGGIYYASLRGGSVAGDHQVIFAGEDERIELGHRAEGRAVFAEGAVSAALWLERQPPGRYHMADVLGRG